MSRPRCRIRPVRITTVTGHRIDGFGVTGDGDLRPLDPADPAAHVEPDLGPTSLASIDDGTGPRWVRLSPTGDGETLRVCEDPHDPVLAALAGTDPTDPVGSLRAALGALADLDGRLRDGDPEAVTSLLELIEVARVAARTLREQLAARFAHQWPDGVPTADGRIIVAVGDPTPECDTAGLTAAVAEAVALLATRGVPEDLEPPVPVPDTPGARAAAITAMLLGADTASAPWRIRVLRDWGLDPDERGYVADIVESTPAVTVR